MAKPTFRKTSLILLPVVSIFLTACDTPIGTAVARESARSVVNDVVEAKLPGAPVTPITDCVINNASGAEIVTIVSDALDGTPGEDSVRVVFEIAQRPDTITCFVEEAGPLVLPKILAAAV